MYSVDTARKFKPRHPVMFYSFLVMMAVIMGLGAMGRGKGYRKWVLRHFSVGAPTRILTAHPSVQCGQPGDMEDHILPETGITAYLNLPNGRIDPGTLNSRNVRLMRTMDGMIVPSVVELSPGGFKLSLHPSEALGPDTNYTFCVTEGVRDLAGAAMEPWAIAFTTKASSNAANSKIRFESTRLKNTLGHGYTALRIGPDHQLYAATDEGHLLRYPILSDGTLGPATFIDSLRNKWGPRIIIGICFEPGSTASGPAIWVTHNEPVFENTKPLGGAISRLSGPSFDVVQDAVINLPRSYRDHMTNQPAFGPDGALYISQGSNSGFGDADPTWGNRAERLFSATVLRLDVKQLSNTPIDAAVLEKDPNYHPGDLSAALSIYASGIRNAYSLVWHTNGHLYVPTNGSSSGGNAPAGDGAPALKNIPFSEDDYLFDVHPGKYYGHPNPVQGHFVLHGGNPLDANSPQRISLYPPGTRPDAAFEPAVYNFGKHVSANGVIEYGGEAFGGLLSGKLLVCRFNLGSDIIALDVAADGKIIGQGTSLPGLRSLACPLDLVEDVVNGNVYVAEYGGKRILLARPVRG